MKKVLGASISLAVFSQASGSVYFTGHTEALIDPTAAVR
jgi:hypothetical protein